MSSESAQLPHFTLYVTCLTMRLYSRNAPQLISERRLCDAVDIILGLQNTDGGFASYELVRGYKWFEWLNPAEVFGAFSPLI